MKVLYLLLLLTKYSTSQKPNSDLCISEEKNTGHLWCLPSAKCSNPLINDKAPKLCGVENGVQFVCCTDTLSETTTLKPGDLSKQKCKEYAEYAYETKTPSTEELPDKQYKCKINNTSLLLGLEQMAVPGEFPHMALIGFLDTKDINWICGGSLISPNYILTVAHCLYHQSFGSPSHAIIGMTKIGEKTQQIVKITEAIVHPDYRPLSFYNDIGLLKIQGAVMDAYTRPACLNTNFQITQDRFIVTGWNMLAFNEFRNKDLLKITVKLFNNTSCNTVYKNTVRRLSNGVEENKQICAGRNDGNDCVGEAGAPLQIHHDPADGAKCMYDIVGVLSFGKPCGLIRNIPNVYTRVSNYIKWIEDNVWQQK